jgi:prephenate dehydrogenase
VIAQFVIIGLGTEGISLGLALRAVGMVNVFGYDPDPAARDAALAAKAIEGAFDEIDRASGDIAFLALPAAQAPAMIGVIAPRLPAHAILTDLSPVMMPSVAAASSAGILPRFVPAHPVPSTQDPIPDAHRFRGASVLIGIPIDSTPIGVAAANLWSKIGGIPASVAPTIHDALFALTHDLPVLSAVALVRTLRRTGSLTRLLAPASRAMLDAATRAVEAGSTTETLAINAPKLLPALELLEREVRRLRHALKDGGPELATLLDEARQFQQELVR